MKLRIIVATLFKANCINKITFNNGDFVTISFVEHKFYTVRCCIIN